MQELPPQTSGEQHIPFVNAIANDHETTLVLNIPNKGSIEGIPADVLVEVPAVVSGRGVQAVHVGPLPAKLMNNVILKRMSQMESILEAYVDGDRSALILWLMADPRTRSYEQAKGLIDKLLDMPWNLKAKKHYR